MLRWLISSSSSSRSITAARSATSWLSPISPVLRPTRSEEASRDYRRRSPCRRDRTESLRRPVLPGLRQDNVRPARATPQPAGIHGRLIGVSSPLLRQFDHCLNQDCPPTPVTAEQSNSSVMLGRPGHPQVHTPFRGGRAPAVEVGRFLSEHARFPFAPRSGGSIEYHNYAQGSEPATVAILEELIENEDVGWDYVVDALAYGLEEALAHSGDSELRVTPPPRNAFYRDETTSSWPIPWSGPHSGWANLLGQRTAEMHSALTSDVRDPDFAPEPLTALDRQALYHGARSLTRRVFREIWPRSGSPRPISRRRWPRGRDPRPAPRIHRLSVPGQANPLPRGLPPRTGAVDGEGLRHHRL